MTLHRATSEGNIPLTPEEEAAVLSQWEYEAANPPSRVVPKVIVLNRTRAEGGNLLGNVYAIMYAPAQEARDALTRWNMPGHLNVFFDDPDTIAVLTMAGATQEQRDRIMAPYP